uniref:Myb/SANT-like domain-containing protein n=1 Tax=Nelumbo nucifera TaxID=4432 RepID=A0A822YUV2_NELNU|nr:TPA_asm: hypothetical protein HUJ06_006513 [Nelumbo nucifera]
MVTGDNFDKDTWKDPALQKLLLDLCLDEVSTHGRQGGSLKKESCMDTGSEEKHLKNVFDYLKRKYQLWLTLINRTRNGYNPSTDTVDWSNELWEEFLKAYPNAKVFRYAGVQFVNECKAVFDGVCSTSEVGWTPLANRPRLVASTGVHDDTQEGGPIDITDTPTTSLTMPQTQTQHTFEESIGPSERPSKREKKFPNEIDATME